MNINAKLKWTLDEQKENKHGVKDERLEWVSV